MFSYVTVGFPCEAGGVARVRFSSFSSAGTVGIGTPVSVLQVPLGVTEACLCQTENQQF